MKTLILILILAGLSGCAAGDVEVTPIKNETPQAASPAPIQCELTQAPADIVGASNILIIGDSISIGYTPHVRSILGVNVIHNNCNAENSTNGVKKVDQWLAQRDRWDLVTFNHGIWDIVEMKVSAQEYAANLRIIGSKIKAKTTRVIFFTTTKLPLADQTRFNEFRAAALQVMSELSIPVYDLEAFSGSIMNYQNADQVHFYGEGDGLLANFVSQSITTEMGR